MNGRMFVNNVSLGLYATAVQRDGYRAAKVRTLLDTVPDVVGRAGRPPDLRWTGPDGESHASGTVLLISNNRYRLGGVMSSSTRPRIDAGELGIAVVESRAYRGWRRLFPRRPWRQWSAHEFEVRSAAEVPAGIDGEAALLTPPIRFRSRPAALRVRMAHAPRRVAIGSPTRDGLARAASASRDSGRARADGGAPRLIRGALVAAPPYGPWSVGGRG